MNALLATARALQRAAEAGTAQRPLRGKHLGLVCDAADSPEADLFRRAAEGLGAQVAALRPSLSEHSSPQEIQTTARMLGRLYDAVECQGLAPRLVQRMEQNASVPVFDGLATGTHPTAGLAFMLDAAPAENRRFVLQAVLQAVLLGSLG